MANLNRVLLLGNVTRDPEVRYTPKGSAVCDLGIAVNRAYTTDSGEKREEVICRCHPVGPNGGDCQRVPEKGQTGFHRRSFADGYVGRQTDRTKADAPARSGGEHATAGRSPSRRGRRRRKPADQSTAKKIGYSRTRRRRDPLLRRSTSLCATFSRACSKHGLDLNRRVA